jgi:hypothetical protein
MLDARGLPVVVLHSVLVCLVCGDLRRDFFGDHLAYFVAILAVNIAELIVERLDDVDKLSISGSGLCPPSSVGTGPISPS